MDKENVKACPSIPSKLSDRIDWDKVDRISRRVTSSSVQEYADWGNPASWSDQMLEDCLPDVR